MVYPPPDGQPSKYTTGQCTVAIETLVELATCWPQVRHV